MMDRRVGLLMVLVSLPGCTSRAVPTDGAEPDHPDLWVAAEPAWPPDDGPRPDRWSRPDAPLPPPDLPPLRDLPRPDVPLPPGACSTVTLEMDEVYTGQPDYIRLYNPGPTPVTLAGFKLVMLGISLETFVFPPGTTLGANARLYVFEYAEGGTADLNTGQNIPFYDSMDSSSVALRDPTGKLVDFAAIGDKLVGVPAAVNAELVLWPPGFDPLSQSFQRVASASACPVFFASDWAAQPKTHP